MVMDGAEVTWLLHLAVHGGRRSMCMHGAMDLGMKSTYLSFLFLAAHYLSTT
jgi:hypothetical protein